MMDYQHSGTITSIKSHGRGKTKPANLDRCICGKCCLPSEQAAKEAVFEARIARALRHNHRRKEDRHYQCRYGAWHITSQPLMKATEMAP